MNSTSKKTLGLVQIALFAAIIFVLAMVPGLGYIPLGVIRATTIPEAIVAGILVTAIGKVFLKSKIMN